MSEDGLCAHVDTKNAKRPSLWPTKTNPTSLYLLILVN